jgi:hypothetical protein
LWDDKYQIWDDKCVGLCPGFCWLRWRRGSH